MIRGVISKEQLHCQIDDLHFNSPVEVLCILFFFETLKISTENRTDFERIKASL